MCRPIRALTEARGHAMSKHVYVFFFSSSIKINEMVIPYYFSDLQVSVVQVANTHAKLRVF